MYPHLFALDAFTPLNASLTTTVKFVFVEVSQVIVADREAQISRVVELVMASILKQY